MARSPADMPSESLSQAPKCPSQAAVSRALGSSSGCCVCFGRSRRRPQLARRIRDRRWKFRGCILIIGTSFICTFSDHRRAAHCGSRPQTWGSQADGPAAWSPQDRWTDIASATPRRCAWAQGRGSGSPLLWDRTHRARGSLPRGSRRTPLQRWWLAAFTPRHTKHTRCLPVMDNKGRVGYFGFPKG